MSTGAGPGTRAEAGAGRGVGRRAVLGAAAAAGATLAAGCGGGDDGGGEGPRVRKKGEKITLTFWAWVPGIEKPVAMWNERHPEVRVKVEKVSPVDGAQYAKMHAAVKAGNPPDLGQIEYMTVPSFLLGNGLADLTEHGAAEVKDRFTGWQWAQSVFGKSVFAIPQASGPMGLFYREDLFGRWGLEPPATWEEYEETARRVRAEGAYIETFAPTNGYRFAGYAWQAGARWFRAEGDEWTVTVDDAPTRKVVDLWERLVREKLVRTDPDRQNAWYKNLQTGRIAAWLGAGWGDALIVGNAPKTKGAWRVAPLPQWREGDNAHANWGGSTTAVFAKCRYPKDATDFAVWLNSDPRALQALIEGGAGWPAATRGWKPADTEKNRAFFGGQHYSDVFARADRAVDTRWQWGPLMDTFQQRFGDAFTDAVTDRNMSFRKALAQVQRETVTDLKDKGLKVKAG
ncbi:ABC transporter substrate-binding protein [Streptomyces iconiensis]|uniref:Extracellular solute-binding protein n=1 Tax=Streptomyces iconiensis TaxID=1384038 RepID=A0ABT6ZWS1_9ACTN|nr:extracellular solute-binding protein [Streptomyces iconiensis]MDJ1133519.1 extracellular solute-binding protein [Streptomyces iconiensis]